MGEQESLGLCEQNHTLILKEASCLGFIFQVFKF